MPSGSNRRILLQLKNNGTHARYIFAVATRLRVKIAKLGNSFPFLARLQLCWGANQFLLCRSARKINLIIIVQLASKINYCI
jgi:hypothetical protein